MLPRFGWTRARAHERRDVQARDHEDCGISVANAQARQLLDMNPERLGEPTIMIHARSIHIGRIACCAALFASGAVACAAKHSSSGDEGPSTSEVAVSAVSGALNNNSGSGVSLSEPAMPERTPFERVLDAINPIGTAYAASWSCTGDTLTPAFSGPGADPYAFTPASCTVTWGNNRTASSSWNHPFTLNYGSMCDATHAFMENQAAGCQLTRTSAAGGTTRTITGPLGNTYAIDHDTNGAGSGWDATVMPAPSNGGVQGTCATGGCTAGRTIVINGSHLTGTVDGVTVWDHTVSTDAAGLTVTGSGRSRVVSGTVIVQHNIIKVTATSKFDNVGYAEPLCCFPTTGSVTTTFSKGSDVGKSESISFSAICGEATLTKTDGTKEALTLQHCL
jgi:hypothetical protein